MDGSVAIRLSTSIAAYLSCRYITCNPLASPTNGTKQKGLLNCLVSKPCALSTKRCWLKGNVLVIKRVHKAFLYLPNPSKFDPMFTSREVSMSYGKKKSKRAAMSFYERMEGNDSFGILGYILRRQSSVNRQSFNCTIIAVILSFWIISCRHPCSQHICRPCKEVRPHSCH